MDLKIKVPNLKYLVVTLFSIIEVVPDFRTSQIVWWGCVGLLGFTFILDSRANLGKIAVTFKGYEKWALPFFAWCVLSLFWAEDMTTVWSYFPTLLITLVIAICFSQMIRTKEDAEAFFTARFIAYVVLAIYIFVNIDLSVLGEERIGTTVLGAGWNANQIALKLTVGSIIGLHNIRKSKNLPAKLIYLVAVVAMVSIMLFCGSRTAFIMAVFGISLSLFLGAKKHRLLILVVVALFILGMLWAVMNIPELYNILGSRLEGLTEALETGGKQGSGTRLRLMMMNKGVEYFKESPIWGYGMNNFRVVFNNEMGISHYSHNNYIEILVSFGIIGALLYFSGHLRLIFGGLKGFTKKGINEYQVFTIGTVLTFFVAGIGAVYYMATDEHVLMAICFACLALENEGEEAEGEAPPVVDESSEEEKE